MMQTTSTCSYIISPLEEIFHTIENEKEIINNSIEKIHKSIDWSRYDQVVKLYFANEHVFVALKCTKSKDAQSLTKKKIVGYIILKDSNYIPYLAVRWKSQRQKLGTLLMQEVINNIKENAKVKNKEKWEVKLNCYKEDAIFYEKFARQNQVNISSFEVGRYREGNIRYDIRLHGETGIKLPCTYKVESFTKISKRFTQEKINKSIKKIHRSVGWSHYDQQVARSLNNGNSYIALKCIKPNNPIDETKEKIVGYVILHGTFISFIAVDLYSQRHGVGSLLLEKIVNQVAKNAQDQNEQQWKITLDCRKNAINFYTGFAKNKHINSEIRRAGTYADKEARFSVYLLGKTAPMIEDKSKAIVA